MLCSSLKYSVIPLKISMPTLLVAVAFTDCTVDIAASELRLLPTASHDAPALRVSFEAMVAHVPSLTVPTRSRLTPRPLSLLLCHHRTITQSMPRFD